MGKTFKKNLETAPEGIPQRGHPGTPPVYTGPETDCPGIQPECCIALATAYVPIQVFNNMYSPCEALNKGTLFPELYRPYPQTAWSKKG